MNWWSVRLGRPVMPSLTKAEAGAVLHQKAERRREGGGRN